MPILLICLQSATMGSCFLIEDAALVVNAGHNKRAELQRERIICKNYTMRNILYARIFESLVCQYI